MKLKAILLFLSLLFSGFAFAEKLVAANCVMGKGCKFHLTDLTESEGEILLGHDGTKVPKGSILVNATINGKTRIYVENKKTRAELDKYYGGDGFTQIGFGVSRFKPKSGIWAVEFGMVKETGCEYINQFQPENPFVSMLQGMKAQRDFRFTDPFDLSVLMPSGLIEWKNGINYYVGVLGGPTMNMRYVIKLKSDILIEGYYRVTTIVPTEGGYCENYIPLTMRCIKADPEKEEWDDWEEQEVIDLFESENTKNNDWIDIPLLDDNEPMPDIPLLDYDKVLPHIPLLED